MCCSPAKGEMTTIKPVEEPAVTYNETLVIIAGFIIGSVLFCISSLINFHLKLF